MLKREEMVSSIPATPWRWAFTALAAAALAACGSGEREPSNDLPKGFTELGATVYPATATGTGATAATQDLLTGGLGKTGLGAAAAPCTRTWPIPRRRSFGAMRCTPTTGASWTPRRAAATARCTAPTSRQTGR